MIFQDGKREVIVLSCYVPWWLRWERTGLQCRRPRFNSCMGKIPWRRRWPPTPVFLPGEFHGQRSLTGYSPWGRKEWDKTEQLTHFHSNKNLMLVEFIKKLLVVCSYGECSVYKHIFIIYLLHCLYLEFRAKIYCPSFNIY